MAPPPTGNQINAFTGLRVGYAGKLYSYPTIVLGAGFALSVNSTGAFDQLQLDFDASGSGAFGNITAKSLTIDDGAGNLGTNLDVKGTVLLRGGSGTTLTVVGGLAVSSGSLTTVAGLGGAVLTLTGLGGSTVITPHAAAIVTTTNAAGQVLYTYAVPTHSSVSIEIEINAVLTDESGGGLFTYRLFASRVTSAPMINSFVALTPDVDGTGGSAIAASVSGNNVIVTVTPPAASVRWKVATVVRLRSL